MSVGEIENVIDEYVLVDGYQMAFANCTIANNLHHYFLRTLHIL